MESLRSPLDMSRNGSLARSNSQAWRRPGQKLRARLVKKDAGVNGFVLSPNCSIEKYHQVSEKVLDQFLQHPIETREELLEAYMVGMRLLRFLDEVLPTHPDYKHNKQARTRATKHSKDLVRYIEEIAIMVDREEHEAFISKVLVEGDEEEDCEVQKQEPHQHEHSNAHHRTQPRKDRIPQTNHNQNLLDDSANSHHTPAKSEDLTEETATTSLSSSPDHSNEMQTHHLFFEPVVADAAHESQEVDISLFRNSSWKQLDNADERTPTADWDAAWAQASSAKASQRRKPAGEDGWSNFSLDSGTLDDTTRSPRGCALLRKPSLDISRKNKNKRPSPLHTRASASTADTMYPGQSYSSSLQNMRHMESVLTDPLSHSISSGEEADESRECVLTASLLSNPNSSFPSESDLPFLFEDNGDSPKSRTKIEERFNEKAKLVQTQVVDWDNASFASKQLILDMNHQLALRGKPGEKLRLIDTEEEDSAEDVVTVSTSGKLMCKRKGKNSKKPIGHHFRQCVKFLLDE